MTNLESSEKREDWEEVGMRLEHRHDEGRASGSEAVHEPA